MEKSLLQDFLRAGMLEIAEDDEKFNHLQRASQEIAKRLHKKRNELITHTLVALDPHILPEEAVLIATEEALTKQWTTFRNRFRDTPRQMLRPIILEALRSVGEADPTNASIIWLTGVSFIPHVQLRREREVCKDFLLQMGNIAEAQAIDEWAGIEVFQASLPTLQIAELSEIEEVEVDSEELRSYLVAAAGPTNPQGQPSGNNPNPHWPNANANWAAQFAERAAQGIASVVTQSINSLPALTNASIADFNTELSNYTSALNTAIETAINRVLRVAAVNETRISLLWWKETLYSPSLRQGYRSMDVTTAAIAMAYDLYTQIPRYSPQSVEFLLREAVREMAKGGGGKSPKKLGLLKMIEQAIATKEGQSLNEFLGATSHIEGRKPLLGFIQAALSQKIDVSTEFSKLVGIQPETEVAIEDFAIWVYRDLQAQRLAAAK